MLLTLVTNNLSFISVSGQFFKFGARNLAFFKGGLYVVLETLPVTLWP